jgi:hypothetical protein
LFVVEPTKKSVVRLGVVEAAKTVRSADGEEEPIPTYPLLAKVVVPMTEVEEAKRPPWNQIGVEVAFAAAPKFVVAVNGKIAVKLDDETLLLKSVQSVLER